MAKRIVDPPFTRFELREVLHYDPETGIFRWCFTWGKVKAGDLAGGRDSHGYLQINIDGKRYIAHRLAFVYMLGHWPFFQVDHIDGDRSNNRWCNLRDVSSSVNLQNRRKASANSGTGLLGAHLHKPSGRYRSAIGIDGKHIYLGMFATAAEAHAVYLEAKRRLHPGCTL